MSIFRSYFLKNNTLISSNLTNNSQNPVTEVSYGTSEKELSRFIFDVDLKDLKDRITQGLLVPNSGMTHILHMTNTIRYSPDRLGKKSYLPNINRASSFDLQLFNVNQNWDEGSGYEFDYGKNLFQFSLPNQPPNSYYVRNGVILSGTTGTTGSTITGVTIIYNTSESLDFASNVGISNWLQASGNTNWTKAGAYISGVTQIIGSEHFEKGDENIDVDVTDYINQRLFGTGYTGTTGFTGSSFGIGIKFPDSFEALDPVLRQAVAFFAKHTNTYYEPYIETTIDDKIVDDRNYFYLDKNNDLFLYLNVGNGNVSYTATVNKVEIFDQDDNLVSGFTGNSIVNISKGVYKVTSNLSSVLYSDAVLFKDKWSLTINGRNIEYEGEFYLISPHKYYAFNNSNQINFENYFFYFWGIGEKENIRAGVTKKIKLTIKELYANQNNFLPLDIEYRLFTTVGKKYELDLIPFTSVNRTNTGYEFNLDTSWLIPQDYFLQLRMKNGDYYENKQTLSFTVVSDGNIKS
jgi:hypothetical protein